MDLPFLKGYVDTCVKALPSSSNNPDRPLAIVVHAKTEALAQDLARQLERNGFVVLHIQAKRVLFRKRWELVARTAPMRYSAATIHSWLDSTYAFVKDRSCSLEVWTPLAVSDAEL